LELVDRLSGEVIREILATIVAAYQLSPANGYTVRVAVRTPWPRGASVFVHVPPGAQMLRVELRVARGRLRLQAEDPATMDILVEQSYRKGYLYPVEDRYVAPSEAGTQLFPSPTAGVWELAAAPMADPNPIFGGDSAQYRVRAEAEIVATVLEAEAGNVDHPGWGAAATTQSSARRRSREPADSAAHLRVAFVNQMGPIGQARATIALGVRRIITGIVDSKQPGPAYEIQVDPGTTSLRVSVRPTDDTTAYLDLYLYNCVTGACRLWEVNAIHGTTSSLLVRAPAAGTWKAIIDPARLPAGRASFTYTEIVTHPTYGRVEVTSSAGPCGAGEQCHVEATVHGTHVVPNGTDLVAVLELIDEAAEAAERRAPLAVFGGLPYRPVAVGTAVIAVGDF